MMVIHIIQFIIYTAYTNHTDFKKPKIVILIPHPSFLKLTLMTKTVYLPHEWIDHFFDKVTLMVDVFHWRNW